MLPALKDQVVSLVPGVQMRDGGVGLSWKANMFWCMTGAALQSAIGRQGRDAAAAPEVGEVALLGQGRRCSLLPVAKVMIILPPQG